MPPPAHASPSRRLWRFGTPVVFLLSGVLFVVSAENSDGTDLRPTRYTDLASIVEAEADEANLLTARVAELRREVDELAAGVGDADVERTHEQIAERYDPAGLTPRSGPAVEVVLQDAPAELLATTTRDRDELVVHQQDIQAVVNAMWRGGAEAVTLQGQRVITTTGIKCTGNTVQIQGVPYSPPYVVVGIGDQGDILRSLEEDDYLEIYREDAADPEISVGWSVGLEEFATAPKYDGLYNMSYAEPMAG